MQKIAFIDDNNNVLESLKLLLKSEPYQLFTFDSPVKALDKIIKDEFAVVVSDQVMPEIEGTKLLQYVKAKWPETECIIMTAYSINRIKDANNYKIIKKPWDVNEFKLTLRDAVAQYEKKLQEQENIQEKKKHILYVENNLNVAQVIMEILKVFGYEATLTTKSTEAIRLLQAQPNLFDIIITDKNLTGLSGLDLSCELAKINPSIPVILCTGDSRINSEEIKKTTGIKGVLFKPFNTYQLRDMLEEMT